MAYTTDIESAQILDQRLDALADTYANLHTIVKLAIGIRHVGRPSNEEHDAWDAGMEDSYKKLDHMEAECRAMKRILLPEE